MMGVIEAGERLSAISDGAVAAATLEAQHRQRHVDQLQRMRDGDRPDARTPRAAPATPAMLASMGIGTVNTASTPPQKGESDD